MHGLYVHVESLPIVPVAMHCQGGEVPFRNPFNIFRFAGGNLFVTCLYALLNFVLDPSLNIKATSYNQVGLAIAI